MNPFIYQFDGVQCDCFNNKQQTNNFGLESAQKYVSSTSPLIFHRVTKSTESKVQNQSVMRNKTSLRRQKPKTPNQSSENTNKNQSNKAEQNFHLISQRNKNNEINQQKLATKSQLVYTNYPTQYLNVNTQQLLAPIIETGNQQGKRILYSRNPTIKQNYQQFKLQPLEQYNGKFNKNSEPIQFIYDNTNPHRPNAVFLNNYYPNNVNSNINSLRNSVPQVQQLYVPQNAYQQVQSKSQKKINSQTQIAEQQPYQKTVLQQPYQNQPATHQHRYFHHKTQSLLNPQTRVKEPSKWTVQSKNQYQETHHQHPQTRHQQNLQTHAETAQQHHLKISHQHKKIQQRHSKLSKPASVVPNSSSLHKNSSNQPASTNSNISQNLSLKHITYAPSQVPSLPPKNISMQQQQSTPTRTLHHPQSIVPQKQLIVQPHQHLHQHARPPGVSVPHPVLQPAPVLQPVPGSTLIPIEHFNPNRSYKNSGYSIHGSNYQIQSTPGCRTPYNEPPYTYARITLKEIQSVHDEDDHADDMSQVIGKGWDSQRGDQGAHSFIDFHKQDRLRTETHYTKASNIVNSYITQNFQRK